MKNYALILLLGTLLPVSAFAVDWDAALGGGVGGAVGSAIGSEVGGRNGAIVGGAVGAAVGTAITTRDQRPHYHEREVIYARPPRREVIYVDTPPARRHCPPGHAKKGWC
jgi:hypothetical protein